MSAPESGAPVSRALRKPVFLSLAAALFIVLATANSGGYRYGASDQAFYIPAIAMTADPTLFPRDRALFEPQMGLWPGGALMAWLAPTPARLPVLLGGVYVLTLVVLFAGAVGLARGLGASWPVAGTFVALLTLKHQIMRTGANSLEGYAHPRMLAFALGVAALAWLVHRRRAPALAALAAAAVVHITTAIWFAIVVAVAATWTAQKRAVMLAWIGAGAALAFVLTFRTIASRLVPMDDEWLAAIGDRAYLFSGAWPISAWLVNLGYAAAIVAIVRRRRSLGLTTDVEHGLVAGLLALVVVFFVSVPLTELRLALAVQLQVNRVFWLLDAVAAFYIAWWLAGDVGRPIAARTPWAMAALLVAASAARGAYLLNVAPARPAVEADLAPTAWTDMMRWLASQPGRWHVLADPQHVWRFGSSVRVAAFRDTLLESGKDPALAIYDRDAARRVGERSAALASFDALSLTDVRSLAARYNLDVFVDRADRRFDLPILYRNDGFVAYDLR